MQESRQFAGTPESVGAARRFVSELAEQWHLGDRAWALVQIVSELASNAVLHAGTDFSVSVTQDGDTTRIEVLDNGSRGAHPRTYAVDATTGRGLHLVENLSREWGASKIKGGKVVWAVVDDAALDDGDPEALLALLDAEDTAEAIPAPRKTAKPRRRKTSRAQGRLAA